MARFYPRFIFSDPQNDKGEGPFIIHCLEPRLILKINKTHTGKFYLVPLDEDLDERTEGIILKDALYWLVAQVKDHQFTIDQTTEVQTIPEFLFAHPKNIKRPGPIVFHCFEPKLLFRVEKMGKDWVCSSPDRHTDELEESVVSKKASLWLNNQIKAGKILL